MKSFFGRMRSCAQLPIAGGVAHGPARRVSIATRRTLATCPTTECRLK